jgi:RimJ/RimL family protein N-acetyltransferase
MQNPHDFEGAEFLRTRRLVLRGLRMADIPAFMALNADEDVSRWSLEPCPKDYFGVAKMVIRANESYLLRPGLGAWHASDVDGHFVGLFTLVAREEGGPVEIGTRLHPSVWGRLYPVEGGRALCEHAFTTLDLPQVVGLCHPHNAAVPAILRRLGFSADGETDDYFGGRALRYVLRRDDWLARESGRRPRRDSAQSMEG